jgi:carboxyl-terminal processing protease
LSFSRDGSFLAGLVAGAILGLVTAAVLAVLVGALGDDGDDPAADARETIEDNYFEKVDASELEDASIEGMLRQLRNRYDDRFSHYFNPEQLEAFEAATSGEFQGVGLTVSAVERGLRVVTVIPDTPAEQAGIEVGDLIVAVDGRSIAGVDADVSTARIKGPAGTEVDLKVVRSPSARARTVTVERASVRVPAVEGRLRRADGERIAYVELRTFSEGVHGELRDTLERLYRRGAVGVLLDLRGNGGGLLNEAVLTSSNFVDEGTIVSTESRAQGERRYEALGNALDPRPMVVLTNGDTASAAEILTAALRDYDLATVVGTRTFGKGSFQEVIHLPAGGALDLTVGRYLTADGDSLADRGIAPDVRATDERRTPRDEALDRGLAVLAGEL